MRKMKYPGWVTLVFCCLVFAVPQRVKADDSGTQKVEQTIQIKDKSFNKKKNITIKESEIFDQKIQQYVWISYKAKSNGYLTIRTANVGNTAAYGYLALFNQSKNVALSPRSICYKGNSREDIWTRNVFGLQKGQTYYIRVKAFTPVTLKSSFKKVKDKSGTLSRYALNLKRNKGTKGLISAGITSPHWYKIKLTKARKITLLYNIQTQGSVRLSFYRGNRMLKSINLFRQGDQKIVVSVKKTTSKGKTKKVPLKKGTYYIRIEPASSITSGYYTLKWK